jgi:hypothetical protein
MRASRFRLLVLAGISLGLASFGTVTAKADDAPGPATLERTGAFEQAYGASFYEFDACGDAIAGRMYRSALTGKVKQCPFSDAAKKRFQLRAAAQRRKSSEVMAKMIEDTGGLPIRLDGMTRTCREQRDSPEYRLVRSRLDDYAAGKSGPDAVIAQPCDAAEIAP